MYKLLKPILFLLPPELAHTITLKFLGLLYKTRLLNFVFNTVNTCHPTQVFGLSFGNPVGIAAGLDKNGDYIDCLAALGVGFIEIGAVTPKPQQGNLKPRLFRLKEDNAIINRMGFNNKGVDYLVENLKRKTTTCIIGVNLGKNKQTPLENAKDDYITCMEKVYPYADFITINISSPNTPDLRKLQGPNYLSDLLSSVLARRDQLNLVHGKRVPVLVKISPDIIEPELAGIVKILNDLKIDGIIATNTTISRPNLKSLKLSHESGGLSGKPIKEQSFKILKTINNYEFNHLGIISCGGIDSEMEAMRRFKSGATLIQIYTGLIYEGPGLLTRCIKKYKTH
ncbi:MAG: dihydroorotate dehydrogenase (quinone) [Burkholderiales bacterium]|jgi:dihydroorotate dehydrogenase|nr:dihydroorotate dehydrogenase (quinone) [Burkholderiales bacterium]